MVGVGLVVVAVAGVAMEEEEGLVAVLMEEHLHRRHQRLHDVSLQP